ncbi:MAG: efflux RND transporter periplasmic adaptor subunit [Deltaproteobacteria bacterium]|nr:efflux RND transporter periplasmic adaptor subunit [Deltaproteobacteria bacterium]
MATHTASAHLPNPLFHPSRRVVLEIVLALAVGGLVFGVARLRGSSRTAQFQFERTQVTRGPIQARVTASGTVNPLVTVQVGTQVSGTVLTLGADFNTQVKRGQMIARIDPRLFRTAVEQARANQASAQAGVDKAVAQLADARRFASRQASLLSQRLISQADSDSADTAARVAEAQLEAARAARAQTQAALDQARLNLAFTTIVSPIDGVVITRNVDVGQTVAASFASPTLFLIGRDLREMAVDTNIPEADVGRLAPGMAASFTVDAYPGETFRGAIREVRNSPQTIQSVVTYDAVIDVANPALKLKPGMTANLSVVYADRRDVVRIPNAALRFRPPAAWLAGVPTVPERRLVWVLRGEVPQAVSIRTGVSDGTVTELVEGNVAPGDQLVTEAIPAQPARGN